MAGRFFLYLFLALLFIPSHASAQVYQEEITVVAPYMPTISDAIKISLSPQTSDTGLIKKQFTYNIQSTILPTPFTFTTLKPARLSGEPLTKLYSNYLRLGMGTYTTPFADYYYNSQRSKDLSYSLRAKHLSSRGEIPGLGFPGMSENLLGFNLRHMGKKGHTKFSELQYQRDVIHFYGFQQAEENNLLHAPKEDIRQRYQQFKLELGLFRHDSDKRKLFHDSRVRLHHLSSLSDSREFSVAYAGKLKKNFNFFDFSDIQELSVKTGLEFIQTTLADSSMGMASLVTVQPTFRTRLGEFDLHAGLRADVLTDSASSLQLSPVLGMKIDVLEHALCISFGLDGEVRRNSMHYLISENPYAGDHLGINFQTTQLRVYGGLDGRLGRHVGFSASLAASKVENATFFVNDTTLTPWSRFTTLSDDMNLFEARAAFTFHFSQKWQSRMRLHYQKYGLGETTPWHIPELSGSFLLSYNLQDKVILKTEVFGASSRPARSYDKLGKELEIKLDPYLDVNLGAEYRYSKILSAFLEVNNLTNKHYEVWNGFGVQGLRFMAGVSYSF